MAACLASCGLFQPAWQWVKPGADDAAYEFDVQQCKAKTYAGSAGAVTQETVRRMFLCMEAKGWRKLER